MSRKQERPPKITRAFVFALADKITLGHRAEIISDDDLLAFWNTRIKSLAPQKRRAATGNELLLFVTEKMAEATARILAIHRGKNPLPN